MNMKTVAFELWDTRSGNLMGSFETEALALRALFEALQAHGPSYTDTVALVREAAGGRSETVAGGDELRRRAVAQAARRARSA